jgi:hypothetical protein
VLSHIVSITLSFLGFKKKIKFEKFNSLQGGKTNKSRSSLKTGRFSKYFSNLPASLENDLGFIKQLYFGSSSNIHSIKVLYPDSKSKNVETLNLVI